jgi:hypothetical protein
MQVGRCVGIVMLVAVGCGPSSPTRDAAVRDGTTSNDGKLADAKLPDAPPPDAPEEVVNCGIHDLECPQGTYMNSCTGGKCFANECCCPTSRQCRAGSFPVCCPDGEVCKNTANGMCGPP